MGKSLPTTERETMTEDQLEKKARQIIWRCMDRMGVKQSSFDFPAFFEEEGYSIMNALEDGLDMAEIQTNVGDLLKPFCPDYY
jgi:hypothetical protein